LEFPTIHFTTFMTINGRLCEHIDCHANTFGEKL